MKKLKSAQHHWWPKCVSSHWTDENGTIGRLEPDGTFKRIPHAKLGLIGNGHLIRLNPTAGKSSHWDECFEDIFNSADANFPYIISWLENLERKFIYEQDLRKRFIAQPATNDQLCKLTESVVSLVVRSPMNREASVSIADSLRGSIPKREREVLIGLNIRNTQRNIADSIGYKAKFAVIFSTGREFVYGDGFYNNVQGIIGQPYSPEMLIPITPQISVIISRPSSFTTEPRLSTIIINDNEVDICNHAIQVYSRNFLFFKSEKPQIDKSFTCAQHLAYSEPNNPICNLIHSIPGIAPIFE